MAIPSGSGQDRCILEDANEQVHLNVSGLLYTTSLNTLKAVPGSRLADTFDGSWRLRRTASGEVFIDRDGEAFGVILQYLRAERQSGLFTVPHLLEDKLARLKAEARFYGLSALHDIIHAGPTQNQMHEGTAQYLAQAARSQQVQLMSRASMDAWAASWMCPEEFLPADSTGSHLTTALAMIGLLEKLGGLQAVIEALGSTSDNIQEQATGALWYLCKDAGIPGQLIQLGALPTVLNFLSSANVAAQENAAGILQELTRLEASHQEIVSMGGHHALVKILQDGSIVARQNAAAALHSLANASIAIDALMDRAQLEPLVSMLSSADARTKQQAAGLLAATFSGACAGLNRGQMVRRQFAEFRTLGGMEKLAQCLEETLLELPVTTCLSALAKDSSSRRAFVHSGTMKLLLQKLVAPEYSLQEQASTTAACVQEQAAVAISELVQDPACAALAQQPASLRHILQLLLVASPAVKGSAFKAMAALAGSEEGRQHLAASGLLDDTTMCSIFGSPSMLDSLEACQYQAKLLQHLCSVNSLWPSIVRCGGPGILASSLGSLCTQVQLSAVRALYKLTIDDDAMRRAFAASSSLTHLIFLLSSPLEEVQQEAAQVMTNLALNDQVQLQLWQLGGLPPLVSLLASPSANCQACSAMAIRNLCYNNDAAQQQAADLQALRPLISQLSSSSELCQASAAWAIRGICWSSDLIRQQAADLHSLQPLQRLLVSADAQVRRHAQLTLDKLAESAAVRRQISALHDI